MPTFLSTHPDPRNRLERVTKLAAEWKKKLNVVKPEVNRNAYLQMIDGMVYGEDPRQGYIENSVFYHPELKFQFPIPNDWTFQNTPQQVQMGAKDGNALLVLRLAPGESLQAAAQTLLQQYQLTAIESRNEQVNGLPAIAIVADQQQQQEQQQGEGIRTLIYLIEYGGNIYSLIGASAVSNFSSFLPTFTATMRNFSPLRDPSKLSVAPERIQIKAVKQSTTLAQALWAHQVKEERFEELAVLNDMDLDERVEQGMLIKVIEK